MLCVRWYLRYKLSFRDLVEMMAERGFRWRTRRSFGGSNAMRLNSKSAGTALLARWASPGASTKPTSKSRVAGPISIVPSTKRERPSMFCFAPSETSPRPRCSFRRAFRGQGRLPHKITLNGYQASHRAASEVLGGNRCETRSSKYLTDVFDKSLSVPGVVIVSFPVFSRSALSRWLAKKATWATSQAWPAGYCTACDAWP